MSSALRVALVQQLHGVDPTGPIQDAAGRGADIVVFPEMYSNGYVAFDATDPAAEAAWRAGAVSPDGDFVRQFREAARSHGVHVVATFLESGAGDPFNAALLVDPEGNTVLHHRKVYTCFFDSSEKVCVGGDG